MSRRKFGLLVAGILVLSGCSSRSRLPTTTALLTDSISSWPESDMRLVFTQEADLELKRLFRQYVEEWGVEFVFCAWGEVLRGTVFVTRVSVPNQRHFALKVDDIGWSSCKTSIAWGHSHPVIPNHTDSAHVQILKNKFENLSLTDEDSLKRRDLDHTILVFARDEEGKEREIVYKLFSK